MQHPVHSSALTPYRTKQKPFLLLKTLYNHREQALELLRRGWPPGDEPRYDPDHALMLCHMTGFRPGLTLLYENLRLFREVLQVGGPQPNTGHFHEQDLVPVQTGAAGRGSCLPALAVALSGNLRLWGNGLRCVVERYGGCCN